MHCTAVAPVPMMPTRLSAELGHRRAGRVAAGVAVVPPARVEACGRRTSRCPGCRAASAGAAGRCPCATNWARISSPRSVRMIQRAACRVPLERGDLRSRTARCRRGRTCLAMRWQCSKISGAMHVLLPTACGRSLRAAAGRSSPRCRTSRPGSGSSTTCRRRRRRLSMMRTSSMPACFSRAPDAQPREPAADERDGHLVEQRLALDPLACTDRRASSANRPVGSRYWSLPSGRSRLSRSSRYLLRRKSGSMVVAIRAVLHEACRFVVRLSRRGVGFDAPSVPGPHAVDLDLEREAQHHTDHHDDSEDRDALQRSGRPRWSG